MQAVSDPAFLIEHPPAHLPQKCRPRHCRRRRIRIASLVTLCISVALILFYCIAGLVAVRYQRNILYLPNYPFDSRKLVAKPEQFGFKGEYEELWLNAGRETLHAYFIPRLKSDVKARATKRHPTIFFCHGNAGNIGHMLGRVKVVHDVCKCNAFVLSYRGYGFSTGTPSHSGIQHDTQAGLGYLLNRADVSPDSLLVFGQSLGGAVAVDLVARNPRAFVGLIVENTFLSLQRLFPELVPIYKVWAPLISEPWDNVARINEMLARNTLPKMLFLSGRKDGLVPAHHMDGLYQISKDGAPRASGDKDRPTSDQLGHRSRDSPVMVKIDNGEHNNTWHFQGYQEAVLQYIRALLPNFDSL